MPALLLALALLPAATSLKEDEVHLKSGGTLVGNIIKEDDAEVKIRTRSGAVVTVRRADIRRVEYKETPEEELQRKRKDLKADDVAGRMTLAAWGKAQKISDQTIDLYREILKIKSDHAAARRKLLALIDPPAAKLLARAEMDGAVRTFEKIVKLYPETEAAARARLMLGRTHFSDGNLGEAERWFRKLYENDPSDVEALKGLIAVYAALDEWEVVGGLIESSALDEEHRALGRRAIELGRRPPKELTPDELVEWARICFAFNATEAGLLRIQRANRKDPKNGPIAARLSELFAGLGRWPEAIAVLRAAEAKEPLERLSWRIRYSGEWDVARSARALYKVEAIVNDVLAGKEVDRLPLKRKPRSMVEATVRRGRRFEAEDRVGEIISRTIPIEADPEQKVRYLIRPPKDYDPLFRYPLVVSLHGSHGRGEHQMASWRRNIEKREGIFLLCPTAGKYGWGSSTRGTSFVVSAVRDVMRRYNIDRDRVYLSGSSMGGSGTFGITTHFPGLAAAISPRIGSFRTLVTENLKTGRKTLKALYVENMKNTPTYWIVGAKDKKVPIEFVRAGMRRMRALKYEMVYHEYPEGGHDWYGEENEPVLDWFATKVRPRYPDAVEFLSDDPDLKRSWWIEVLEHAGSEIGKMKHADMDGNVVEERPQLSPPARLRARVARKRNGFRVSAKGVRRYRIYLHDAMVDFSRPITVTTNGRTRIHKEIRPSVDFLLDEARRTGDRTRTYWAAIDVTVKK